MEKKSDCLIGSLRSKQFRNAVNLARILLVHFLNIKIANLSWFTKYIICMIFVVRNPAFLL